MSYYSADARQIFAYRILIQNFKYNILPCLLQKVTVHRDVLLVLHCLYFDIYKQIAVSTILALIQCQLSVVESTAELVE